MGERPVGRRRNGERTQRGLDPGEVDAVGVEHLALPGGQVALEVGELGVVRGLQVLGPRLVLLQVEVGGQRGRPSATVPTTKGKGAE